MPPLAGALFQQKPALSGHVDAMTRKLGDASDQHRDHLPHQRACGVLEQVEGDRVSSENVGERESPIGRARQQTRALS